MHTHIDKTIAPSLSYPYKKQLHNSDRDNTGKDLSNTILDLCQRAEHVARCSPQNDWPISRQWFYQAYSY